MRKLWKKKAEELDAKIKGLPGSLDQERRNLEAKLAAIPPDAPQRKEKLLRRQ